MVDIELVTLADAENPIVGDIRLVDAQLAVVAGREAIAQDLNVCLRWFRGEWFLDLRLGFPWFQRILGIENGSAALEVVLRRAVLQRPGIATIERLTINVDTDTREVSVDALDVRTIDGDLLEVPPFNLGEFPEVGA